MNVLFLAAEADPLIKVGGLGDVAGSLPRALQAQPDGLTGGEKIDVRLVLPFYAAIRRKIPDPAHVADFEVPTRNGPAAGQAFETTVNGIHTYLISGSLINAEAPVYSSNPALDAAKFFFFSLAALELVRKIDWQPDILHANDWHTALAVYALKSMRQREPFFANARSVLTIHNLPFMGVGTGAVFDDFGLAASASPRLPEWARKVPLALGLESADRIVAVSQSYARELVTPEYGCGLETFLKSRQKAILGIVNGLDQENWNPATDAAIPQKFSVQTLAERRANKTALLKEFSLDAHPDWPLLIIVSRMDPQKGVDLAVEGLRKAAGRDWQAILLGTGDPNIEHACLQLAEDYPKRVRAAIRFDASLSRRMYAGGDILLMPSRYEPCGLAQMIAMRYGCVPLARATGGLQDTIQDADRQDTGTGFLFKNADAAAFTRALDRALESYQSPACWQKIQINGMRQDFSWQKSSKDYTKLYELLKEDSR